MGNYKPWEQSSREKSYYLTVSLSLGGKGATLSLPPVLIVLLLVLGFSSYKIANMESLSIQQRQAQKIAELERRNGQLQTTLEHKEKERDQMVALADARSKELWAELDSRDRELARLWHVVGDKPSTLVRQGTRPRQSLLGSRHGNRRSALAVKVGYSQLESQVKQGDLELKSLVEAAYAYRQHKIDEYRAELANHTPSIRPCKGQMTSGFGYRIHPIYGYGRFHSGCDFTTPYGTPIHATAAGVVCHSDWLGGYGKVVEIDHGNGLKTMYCHCSELLVKKGDKVVKGQDIAKVGTTGFSTGPHCHYEVRRGDKQIDPSPYYDRKDATPPIAKL